MAQRERNEVQTLERGNIYFFYRPRVERDHPESREDIANLYMILSPDGKRAYRRAIIGRERLPEPQRSGRQRIWGFVQSVTRNPREMAEELTEERYETKTRGERRRPAARPAGEGLYQILRHRDHTHLVYALELPKEPSEVQRELHIAEEASYVISIKNPEQPSPPRAGLPRNREADYPKGLMERFGGRRFGDADPPDYLDHEGAQFILISAAADVKEELGFELQTEDEDESSAEIFRDLRLRKSEHPVEPLFRGEWA